MYDFTFDFIWMYMYELLDVYMYEYTFGCVHVWIYL